MVRKFLWIESRGEFHLRSSWLLIPRLISHEYPTSFTNSLAQSHALCMAPAIMNYLLFSDYFVILHFNFSVPSSPSITSGSRPLSLTFLLYLHTFYNSGEISTSSKNTFFLHSINRLPLFLWPLSWPLLLTSHATYFILQLSKHENYFGVGSWSYLSIYNFVGSSRCSSAQITQLHWHLPMRNFSKITRYLGFRLDFLSQVFHLLICIFDWSLTDFKFLF